MKTYWVEQEGGETVCDALLRVLEAKSWGTAVSQTYHTLLKSTDNDRDDTLFYAKEMKALMEKFIGQQ